MHIQAPYPAVAEVVWKALPLFHLLSERETGGTRAQGAHEVILVGDLGLNVIRKPVDIVAGEHLTTRHGPRLCGRPHLLDVVVVLGVNNGRDVKVVQLVPAREGNLAKHAWDVVLAVLDGVEVADPSIREGNSGVLLAVDLDGLHSRLTSVASEVDSTLNGVEGPEGDCGGLGDSRSGDQSHGRG